MKTILIEFPNKSGLILRGIATMPDGHGPFPTVINLHGFGGSKGGYKSLHISMGRALAECGAACVRYDFSCNGESDGEFENMTFTGLLNDTRDIYGWTEKQTWADAKRIFLSGQSMGGYLAATAAPMLNPHALILMCPGAGMWYGCKERSKNLESQGILYGDVEGLKLSHQFNYDLANYDPFETAKGYSGPVLILRGTNDKLVDDKTCDTYLALYSKGSKFLHIANGDHNFSSIPARESLNLKICSFVKDHL